MPKNRTRTYPWRDVTICLDAALSSERDSLIANVKKGPADHKKIRDVEERMRQSLVIIRVTGVPYKEYLKVQRAHPGRKGIDFTGFNMETFWGDFVYKTASEVENDGSLTRLSTWDRAEWDDLYGGLTSAELDALAIAVDETNAKRQDTGFLSQGSVMTEPSGPNSGQPDPGE